MSTADRSPLRVVVVLLLLSWVASRAAFALLPQLFGPWNASATDQLFRVREAVPAWRPAPSGGVVHVDLNLRSIRALGDFYPDRGHHARAVRNLAAMDVAAIVYDYIFVAATQPEEDRAFISAVRDAGRVFLGEALLVQDGVDSLSTGLPVMETFPPLREAARGIGFLNLTEDRDGGFRRVPLVFQGDRGLRPSIVLATALHVLDVELDDVRVEGRSLWLPGARDPATGVRSDRRVPIDERGNMLVNYVGPWGRLLHYDFADVLEASRSPARLERWRRELAGRVVVVSEITPGAADVGPTPLDGRFPLSGVHANALHTLLTGAFLREAPALWAWTAEAALVVLTGVLAFRLAAIGLPLALIGLGGVWIAVGTILFVEAGILLHVLRPLFFLGFAALSVTAWRYAREERIRHAMRTTFAAYFPSSVVDRLLHDPEFVTEKAQKKEITVLFSDVQDFTQQSNRLSPEALRLFLNDYFAEMTEIVFRHSGTLDKFIGDGLMVIFGDPEDQPDHAVRGVRAALAMQRRIRERSEEWERRFGFAARVRIGVNSGVAVVGNLGSPRRLSYTALGAEVNRAQRLEAAAPPGGILVSRRTRELLGDAVPIVPHAAIHAKGFEGSMETWLVEKETSPG